MHGEIKDTLAKKIVLQNQGSNKIYLNSKQQCEYISVMQFSLLIASDKSRQLSPMQSNIATAQVTENMGWLVVWGWG